MFEVPEGHKLDDVSKNRFSSRWIQDPFTTVQHLHVTEISIANANNNDGHGEVGGLNDGLPCVGHVSNDTICQDEEDEVLLFDTTKDKLLALSNTTYFHLNSEYNNILVLNGPLQQLFDNKRNLHGHQDHSQTFVRDLTWAHVVSKALAREL